MIPISSRERVEKTFNHQFPDRVALDFGSKMSTLTLAAYEDLKKFLGIEAPTQILDERIGIASIDEFLLDRFQIDTRYIHLKPSKSWDPQINPVEDTIVDEWGGKWKRPKGGIYYEVQFPIKEPTLKAIQKHRWLDPDDSSRWEGLKEEAKLLYQKGYAIGTFMKGVFETTWILRGFENALMDIALNQKFYHALAHKTSEILERMVENLVREVGDYLQFFCIACDQATQLAPMISPSDYKTFVKPYEKRLIDVIKRRSKAKLALHSCGAVFKRIPSLLKAVLRS